MKYLIRLKQQRGAFAQTPGTAELDEDLIQAEGACLTGVHPHGRSLYVLGDISGAICAVWADNDQEAFDEAADQGFLDQYQVEESEVRQRPDGDEDLDCLELIRAGNASEPFGFDQAWSAPALRLPDQEVRFIIAMACSSGRGDETVTRP